MRAVHMTAAQQHAQDASVRNLWHVMRETEAHLQARVDAADARERLCACGIELQSCLCPLRRESGVRISYAKV